MGCRELNTGVMVFTPSAERLQDIVVEIQRDNHTYHFPDQQFFSRYLRTRGVSFKLLDSGWNNCGHDPLVSLEGRPWVGHFCQSWKEKTKKNYQLRFCTEGSNCSVSLRAWQAEALAMDACLGRQTQTACGAHGACGWCGAYCMDRRISCTGISFDQDTSQKR